MPGAARSRWSSAIAAGRALDSGGSANHAVNQGAGAENHLELRCIGDRIQFLVNGTTVIDLTDDSLVGGRVALSAASLEDFGYAVWFMDVVVTGPVGAEVPGVVSFSDFSDGPGDWTTENRNRGVLETPVREALLRRTGPSG